MAYNFDAYRSALSLRGETLRERNINLLKRDILVHAKDNPAYKQVIVNDEKTYAIVNAKSDYTVKEILPMPGERFPFGGIVLFADMPWIITSTDVDDEIYSRSEMHLCNCVMRWKDKHGKVHSYHGSAEDATKYSEGVESTQYLRVGEFQLKVKITVDQYTALINRDMRFVIDASTYMPDIVANNDRPFVFRTTRRNIVTGTYPDEGYVEITLVQDAWLEGQDDYVDMLAAQPWELKEPYDGDKTKTEEPENNGGWL